MKIIAVFRSVSGMAVLALLVALQVEARAYGSDGAGVWRVVREHQQRSFAGVVPPGNYSGITPLGGDVYAMVSDKSDSALYFNVRLHISRSTGELLGADYLGGHGAVDAPGLDNEAIARVSDSTVVIASEGKCRLKEVPLGDTGLTGRPLWEWTMPDSCFYPNYVFESLAYDSVAHRLWTVNEAPMRRDGLPATTAAPSRNVLRLMAFDWNNHGANPVGFLYRMDMPTTARTAQTYVMGVSELCVLPDGQLLVLEREAFVPKQKIGAFCNCKLYVVDTKTETPYCMDSVAGDDAPYVKKRLLTSWRTTLGLFNRSWANYEGMCLGPRLDDGSQVLVLVSDSQDGYAGVLRDWFRTIVIQEDRKTCRQKDMKTCRQKDM